MQSNNMRWARGFTIIEVLIVLAIAGLILIIIFLAVPALQRNSRNTQRKHDVSLMAASIANFKSGSQRTWLNRLQNDGGTDLSTIDIAFSGDTTNFGTFKIGYYKGNGSAVTWGPQAGNIFINPANSLGALKTPLVQPPDYASLDQNNISTENVAIFSGETCDDTGSTAGVLQSTAVALFYVTENGNNNGDLHCVEAY